MDWLMYESLLLEWRNELGYFVKWWAATAAALCKESEIYNNMSEINTCIKWNKK